jgi:hypothetical protein
MDRRRRAMIPAEVRMSMRSGALVGTHEGPNRRVTAALTDALTQLGFLEGPAGHGIEATRYDGDRGAWLWLSSREVPAHALASRLAASIARPARLFSVCQPHDEVCEADLRDELMNADGSRVDAPDSFTRGLIPLSEVCDAKSYFLLSSLRAAAVDELAPDATPTTFWLAPPPSLGTPRLDALALEVRTAIEAQVTDFEGRRCLRMRTLDGVTQTSFLSDEELELLIIAVPTLRG